MIDIENELITRISQRLRSEFNPIYVTGENIRKTAKFPHVTIVEYDNATYRKANNSCGDEYARLIYEFNIYSNLTIGKKQQCKDILKIIDGEMMNMGFSRIFRRHISNIEDATIHRVLVRYYGIVDDRKYIYRG